MPVIWGSMAAALVLLVFSTLVYVYLKKKTKPNKFIHMDLLKIDENEDETVFGNNSEA